MVAAALAHVAVQAQRQLEVLPDARRVEAADLHQHVAAVHAERAGDEHQRLQAGPARATHAERAQVLHHLEAGDPAAGHPDVGHTPADERRAVHGAHGTTGGHHALGVVGERPGDGEQRVGI
ncbi:MAG: hypothetical protein PGN11_12270 [Quadrisphaera sp.]